MPGLESDTMNQVFEATIKRLEKTEVKLLLGKEIRNILYQFNDLLP